MLDGSLLRDPAYKTNEGFGLGATTSGVDVPVDDDGADATEITIDDDGGVTIGTPAIHSKPEKTEPANFGENLALKMDDGSLAQLGAEIREGVEADIQSRQRFISNLTNGLELLGLEIEAEGATKGQKRNVSRVRHPVLLEAITKAQSQASAELFPSDGPCKAMTRGSSTGDQDEIAQAFQDDMNWYLTQGAKEYRPDGERGLFGFFFSGNWFRKVYAHPLRRRPVADSISVEDLIVSEETTDLDTAIRITHRNTDMPPAMVRRMQVFGGWRDVSLGLPMPAFDPLKTAQQRVQGISPVSTRPQDMPHTIDETITDLVLADYGKPEHGVPDGLPVSYAVTMDWDSQQVLAVHRRWRFGDKEYQRRHPYVHYQMIPAFGFLALGYVHLLGNQAKALTAIWRLLCDAGLFSNFPGGVKAKGVRIGTNEIAPGPGEWPDVDIGSMDDIRKALMPMPYKDPSPVFIQLAEIIGQDAQRLAGAIEFDVGEGQSNVPVGTMLAMVEQATQTTAAVHKRMHAAQARELLLLKECFAQDPEALHRLNPNPKRKWTTAREFADVDIVPGSDPNVPAQIHRIMIALALVTMAGQNPDIYDRVAAHIRAWTMIGVGDADSFVRPAPPVPPDQSAAAAAQATLAAKQMDIQFKQQENQRKAASEAVEAQQKSQETRADLVNDAADRQSKERIEGLKVQTERMKLSAEHMRAQQELAQAAHQHQVDTAQAQHQHATELAQTDQHHAQDATMADQHHSEQRADQQMTAGMTGETE